MELGNEWLAVLSRGVESVVQAGLVTWAQFVHLEEKVREDWELDNRIAELFCSGANIFLVVCFSALVCFGAGSVAR